jgi:3-hydroxyisobutyrate dehydrogenase-like beta-hydroxyacid dehydrogenase
VVGLGIMGSAIAANLVRSGHAVVGYDVAASRRRIARAAGALAVGSVSALAERTDIIVCSLPSTDALANVSDQIARAHPRNASIVETSTLPLDAKEAARRVLRARRDRHARLPDQRHGAQARTADLVLYASGDRAAFDRAAPVLQDSRARSISSARLATARR